MAASSTRFISPAGNSAGPTPGSVGKLYIAEKVPSRPLCGDPPDQHVRDHGTRFASSMIAAFAVMI
jgi:hypothetical protein